MSNNNLLGNMLTEHVSEKVIRDKYSKMLGYDK